ncbi:unnamed protein product [Pedinophyceae sp. YPF-701]|nr:unnamed protein product [Pedinophyceae sp. YPF-701]
MGKCLSKGAEAEAKEAPPRQAQEKPETTPEVPLQTVEVPDRASEYQEVEVAADTGDIEIELEPAPEPRRKTHFEDEAGESEDAVVEPEDGPAPVPKVRRRSKGVSWYAKAEGSGEDSGRAYDGMGDPVSAEVLSKREQDELRRQEEEAKRAAPQKRSRGISWIDGQPVDRTGPQDEAGPDGQARPASNVFPPPAPPKKKSTRTKRLAPADMVVDHAQRTLYAGYTPPKLNVPPPDAPASGNDDSLQPTPSSDNEAKLRKGLHAGNTPKSIVLGSDDDDDEDALAELSALDVEVAAMMRKSNKAGRTSSQTNSDASKVALRTGSHQTRAHPKKSALKHHPDSSGHGQAGNPVAAARQKLASTNAL